MRDRSLGVTTLAFSSVMVALYSQYAAIALVLTGSVYTAAGSLYAAVALMTGAAFLSLAVAAYAVGYGFWARKHWSWATGIAVFAFFIGANVFLSIISTSFVSALLPTVGGVIAIAYLQRPAVRAELLGTEAPAEATVRVADAMDAAEPAH